MVVISSYEDNNIFTERHQILYIFYVFFFKQKPAYVIHQWLQFRRVLFRSSWRPSTSHPQSLEIPCGGTGSNALADWDAESQDDRPGVGELRASVVLRVNSATAQVHDQPEWLAKFSPRRHRIRRFRQAERGVTSSAMQRWAGSPRELFHETGTHQAATIRMHYAIRLEASRCSI